MYTRFIAKDVAKLNTRLIAKDFAKDVAKLHTRFIANDMTKFYTRVCQKITQSLQFFVTSLVSA